MERWNQSYERRAKDWQFINEMVAMFQNISKIRNKALGSKEKGHPSGAHARSGSGSQATGGGSAGPPTSESDDIEFTPEEQEYLDRGISLELCLLFKANHAAREMHLRGVDIYKRICVEVDGKYSRFQYRTDSDNEEDNYEGPTDSSAVLMNALIKLDRRALFTYIR